MTAQVAEVLYYKSEELPLRTQPLSTYFILSETSPAFQFQYTSCWRSYIGTWEILLDRLYLTGIKATYADGTAVTLGSLFPGFEERVFAHWYSGVLSIPQGKMTKYVHGGYMSRFERDLLLTVENGVVIHTEVRENPPEKTEEGSHLE